MAPDSLQNVGPRRRSATWRPSPTAATMTALVNANIVACDDDRGPTVDLTIQGPATPPTIGAKWNVEVGVRIASTAQIAVTNTVTATERTSSWAVVMSDGSVTQQEPSEVPRCSDYTRESQCAESLPVACECNFSAWRLRPTKWASMPRSANFATTASRAATALVSQMRAFERSISTRLTSTAS